VGSLKAEERVLSKALGQEGWMDRWKDDHVGQHDFRQTLVERGKL
jgi:hypothetical protein